MPLTPYAWRSNTPLGVIDIVSLIRSILALPTHWCAKQRLVPSICDACYPLLCTLRWLWQASNVRSRNLARDVLRRLSVTSIKKRISGRNSRSGCAFRVGSLSTRAFQLPRLCVLGLVPSPRRRLWAFRLDCRFGLSRKAFQFSCCFLTVLSYTRNDYC